MPCPYFLPLAPVERSPWSRPPRVPLGDLFDGTCSLGGCCAGDALMSSCNCGYGRGKCAVFPADAECDALRYSIAEDRGVEIEIVFVYEKDYAPLRHGRAIYSRENREVTGLAGIAAVQAGAFAAGYARRATPCTDISSST